MLLLLLAPVAMTAAVWLTVSVFSKEDTQPDLDAPHIDRIGPQLHACSRQRTKDRSILARLSAHGRHHRRRSH